MSNTVRLFFAGDFCSKPSTSLISVSDELKALISGCDVKVVNFEVPLKPDLKLPSMGYERFFQNDDAPVFLKNLGFNLFPIANNHLFDWGDEGFLKVKHAFGDASFGAGSYEEAYRVKCVETKGKKIGFLALTFATKSGVFYDVMNHDGLGCAYIHDLKVNHVIMEAKKEVDYLIVLPHDGIEFIDAPLPEVMARYRDFVEYGADAVIGTHPHCPQGWEEYKGKPIFYSLGNFFFNSKNDTSYRAWNRPHWYEGLCIVMEIDADGVNYTIYNTFNKDNVGLFIDHSPSKEEHNSKICSYLIDEKKYQTYLQGALKQTALYDLGVLDASIYKGNLKTRLKTIAKRLKNNLKGIDKQNDPQLKEMMQNDTRRIAMLRYLSK
ncbi:MAG: CapA family protein [Paludibacteraceae bacterium]|nr:CapA family protein [Paludibacteraceae bacterium]